ncbi:hypothetical protein [Tessaracoccus oleiagri]|uniref:Uncharacterized protein n=1 Tax=Tessaracoccus oleiagri TaxID=686624 RepID=A0A1G9JIA1_9ACTN|nr:hypothetical protein [Tessaracoccus oleiagri]SDL37022.1 hypothetical protein SAMN04488242_1257 [Tessaracoccus oleiagri]
MTDPREEASWDELTRFAERQFDGVSGQVTATVDGTLSITAVRAHRFGPGTAASVGAAINHALTTARRALAKHLATTTDLDLPGPLRALLEGAAAPESHRLVPPHDYEASRAGVIVQVDGDKCLVKRVVIPTAAHLALVPTVANAVLTAAESGRVVPLHELFDASWMDIVAQLDDLDGRLDAILAEPGHNQD